MRACSKLQIYFPIPVNKETERNNFFFIDLIFQGLTYFLSMTLKVIYVYNSQAMFFKYIF